MENSVTDTNTKAGTLGGTLLVVVANLGSELGHAALMAAAGAATSFAVSALLGWIMRRVNGWRQRRRRRKE